jgi:hypothetical protein
MVDCFSRQQSTSRNDQHDRHCCHGVTERRYCHGEKNVKTHSLDRSRSFRMSLKSFLIIIIPSTNSGSLRLRHYLRNRQDSVVEEDKL